MRERKNDGAYPQFEAVLAAFEIDHIAGGRVDGTENIKKVFERLNNRDKQDVIFREALGTVISDGSGGTVDDIASVLSGFLASEVVNNSLMWNARDFCRDLGKEIAKRSHAGER